ncbi:MAG: thioredoxin family protein [Nannocystales bacterium]
MSKRTVEIFSAGCPACKGTIQLVNNIACPSCDVSVLDMKDPTVSKRAKDLGITRVPAVVVNGKLADCCVGSSCPTEAGLRTAGVGSAA